MPVLSGRSCRDDAQGIAFAQRGGSVGSAVHRGIGDGTGRRLCDRNPDRPLIRFTDRHDVWRSYPACAKRGSSVAVDRAARWSPDRSDWGRMPAGPFANMGTRSVALRSRPRWRPRRWTGLATRPTRKIRQSGFRPSCLSRSNPSASGGARSNRGRCGAGRSVRLPDYSRS